MDRTRARVPYLHIPKCNMHALTAPTTSMDPHTGHPGRRFVCRGRAERLVRLNDRTWPPRPPSTSPCACHMQHRAACARWPRSARRHRRTRRPSAPKSARPAGICQGFARQPPPAPQLAHLGELWQPACSRLPAASATAAAEPHRMGSTQHRQPAHTASAAQPGAGVDGRH